MFLVNILASMLDRDSPSIKIKSRKKAVVKIGNMTPEIGKLIFKPSYVVLD
jgi:hypothetical protein